LLLADRDRIVGKARGGYGRTLPGKCLLKCVRGDADESSMIARRGIPACARGAFSLLELMIVVVIVAVLAAIAIPRISRSAEGAAESALKQDLRVVRNAIEMFTVEHGGKLPASVSDGTNKVGTLECFQAHLWYYSNAGGVISKIKQTGYPFGPHLKKFPKGPVGPAAGRITVKMVKDGKPLTGEAKPDEPWRYDYTTGEFIFNWDALSSDGVTRYDQF